MAQGIIYTVSPDGSLQKMAPSAPENEDRMQELVARYPELITDGDGDLLLVRRELSIADSDNGAGRWSLDHLFVTKNAVPVLVEMKRAVDTRLRREVVGQMMDYAANATAYWQAGKIAERFAQTTIEAGDNPEEMLFEFIGEQDPIVFWEQVDANFKAGRIKLVFVADEIPRELARIVEFMNEQMRADVRAVELRWFTSNDGHVSLSPRIIGETERAAAIKRPAENLQELSRDEWVELKLGNISVETRQGAQAFVRSIESAGGVAVVSKQQKSLIAVFRGEEGRAIYIAHLWPEDQTISFSLRWLHTRKSLSDESIRRRLFEGLQSAVGQLSGQNLKGFPSFRIAALANEGTEQAFANWLREAYRTVRATS